MANRLILLAAVLSIVGISCDRAPVNQAISRLTERSVHTNLNRVDETLSISLQDAFFVQLSQPVLNLSMVYHGNDLHSRYDASVSFRSASGEWLGNPLYVRFCNCGSAPGLLTNEHAFIWAMPASLPSGAKVMEVVFIARSGSGVRRVVKFDLPPVSEIPYDDIFRPQRIPPLNQKELSASIETQYHGENNGCRQRLEVYLSFHRRFPLAVA